MKKNLVLLVLLIFAISCSDKPETGPAEVYYGGDICERCKMIISEKDYAAQYQLSNGKAVKFDDLGCMIHYMNEEHDANISSVYVMDYYSKKWIDGHDAYYIWSQDTQTPMGYGILAFKQSSNASELTQKENVKPLGNLKNASLWLLKDSNNNQN